MKRILWMLAVAAMAVTACQKPQYIIPIDDDEEEETPGDQEGFKEKTFVVNLTMKEGVNNDYSGVVGTMPGTEILDFLGLTKEEFYKGMGTCSTGSMSSAQSNNTILFGVANANSTEDLKWVPSTSNNFGHWFGKDGALVTWGDDAYFFTENLCEWGAAAPDADTYEAMWTYTVGCFPGRTVAGETYKATEVFFYTNEDEVELYAYVQWNITIEAAEEVKLNVVGTQEINFTAAYNGAYEHTPLVPEIDQTALQNAIGLTLAEADVYGVNPDGSFSLAPGKNFWFTAEDGTIGSWGDSAGICINDDGGTNDWAWCMFPNEALAGQTCKGAIAFVNPSTLNAYVVKVSVAIGAQDTWAVAATLQVQGDPVETYPDFAPIAAYLGFENVDGLYDALCDGSVYPVGVNADGSLFLGEDGKPAYSQANEYNADWGTYIRGVFFSKEGTGSYWNTGEDNFYSTMYWYQDEGTKTIEVDITPFAVTEEDLGTYSYKWGFVKDDKMACLEMQITLESAVPWNTVAVEGTTATIKMVPTGGYKGMTVTFDNAAIASGLGTENLAAEIESGDIVVVGLNADGSIAMSPNDATKYWNSGETPYGHWFGANGNVCSWGTDARVCCNIKTEGATVYTAMCQMDSEGGSTCVAGDTYKYVQRFIKGDKTVDITYNISIVETL